MAITTYAELQTNIADFLDRDDLGTLPQTFIALAEAQMSRDIRHWRMVERATVSMTTRYTALPSNWVETIRLTVNGNDDQPLKFVSMDWMKYERARNDDVSGTPAYYAHLGAELEVYPTPDATYTAEITYYETIPALSDAATTNWVLTNAPDAYLYGALIHSAGYLQEDARSATWSNLYGAAVAALNDQSRKAQWSGSGLRLARRMR